MKYLHFIRALASIGVLSLSLSPLALADESENPFGPPVVADNATILMGGGIAFSSEKNPGPPGVNIEGAFYYNRPNVPFSKYPTGINLFYRRGELAVHIPNGFNADGSENPDEKRDFIEIHGRVKIKDAVNNDEAVALGQLEGLVSNIINKNRAALIPKITINENGYWTIDGTPTDVQARGPKGDPGQPGPAGADGQPGPAGADGQPGPKGDKGDPGQPGPKGDKGDPGQPGPAGANGQPGPAGAEGQPGPKGDKGDPGQPGPKGDKGDPGQPGPAGANGQPGPAGAEGQPGPKGDKGDPGQPGPKGDKGDPGQPGPAGADGQPGPKGDKGDPGQPGPAGADGAPGPEGPEGPAGKNGRGISKITVEGDVMKIYYTDPDGSGSNEPTEIALPHDTSTQEHERRFNALDNRIQTLDDDMRRGLAQSAALAGLKAIQFDPDKPSQIMLAVGSYRNRQAYALGLSHYVNDSTLLHAGISYGGNHHMLLNAGVTFKFGSK